MTRVHLTKLAAEAARTDDLGLLTKPEGAALLKINSFTFDRRWKSDPAFPQPIWIGGATPRWRRSDIAAWLETCQQGGISPSYQNRRTGQLKPGKRSKKVA